MKTAVRVRGWRRLAAWCIALVTMAAACTGAAAAPLQPHAEGVASASVRAAQGRALAATSGPVAGSTLELAAGALRSGVSVSITSAQPAVLPLFPGVPVVRAEPATALAAPATLRIVYGAEFAAQWNVADEQRLGLYEQDAGGLWRRLPATFDDERHTMTATVERLSTWAIVPGGMLAPWQEHTLSGSPFEAGKRNALVIHGWNASPWDGCMLRLTSAVAAGYDHVLAYAYPSALDIAANGAWLRREIARRYAGADFDVIAFSEGGLVARTAIEPGSLNGGRTLGASVRNLLTIATPHLGLVAGAPPSVLGDVAAEQMRPGSPFLRELDASPAQGATRYHLIAGNGAPGGAADGTVGVESALARGLLHAEHEATLPLVHAPSYGAPGAMPCDQQVYDAIRAWER